MNRQPIDHARDPDLRHSLPALRRAAQRAPVIAAIKAVRRRSAIRSRTCPRSSDFCVEAVGRDTSKASV